MPHTKTLTWQVLKHEPNGSPYFEKTTEIHEFDAYFQKWVKKSELTKVEKLKPEQIGLVKNLDFQIIIKRSAISESTLTKKTGFFLQRYKVSIPKEKRYNDDYISMPKGVKRPHINHLAQSLGNYCGFCEAISPNDTEYIKKVGTAKRITVTEARHLIEQKAVIGVFTEDGSDLSQFLEP
jgi:hypothetical protein